jgi:hypothetical protein
MIVSVDVFIRLPPPPIEFFKLRSHIAPAEALFPYR